MIEDTELLRRFAEEKSETSFAELVERQVNFVYACALRRVGGDAHLARDVAQQVFIAVARNAAALAKRHALTGWLYTTTRNASAQVVRGERRRHVREHEADLMNELTRSSAPDAEWERLQPLLDESLDGLNDDDREAVLLRFSEGKSFAEVGARLRLNENAARMRVERSLDKMRARLARRGVTSTSAALALVLANQAGVAAPSGLAASLTAAVLTPGATSAAGILFFMSTPKLGIGIAAVCASVALGVALFEAKALNETRRELAAVVAERANGQVKLEDLEKRLAFQTQRAAAAEDDTAKLLKAVQSVQTAQAVPLPPITHDAVDARYKRAKELARTGHPEEALKEFLWCFDDGMPHVAGFGGVRLSYLLDEIEKMGPAGTAALRERRDRAQKRILGGEHDFDAAMDFSSINHALEEDNVTIALYDQLPLTDERRQTIAIGAYDQLISAQRYTDAVQARPYGNMASLFEIDSEERPLPATMLNQDKIRQAQRDSTIHSTSESIEVLAGAGDVEHARTLAKRLLAFDGSDATKAILQQHLVRAGHADLLTAATK